MNNHELIIGKSNIVEGIQLLASVFLNEVDDIYKVYEKIPVQLRKKMKESEIAEKFYGETMLITGLWETLLFIRERNDVRAFHKKLLGLTENQMRYALSNGGLIRMNEMEKLSEDQLVDIIKKAGVKDVDKYIEIYKNPYSFFREYGKLLCEIVESPEFKKIFTENTRNKLDDECKKMKEEMIDRHPLSYAQSLMGKSFYNIADWSRYEFIPVEIGSFRVLRLMNDETNILLYNVNQGKEEDEDTKNRLVANMKVFSDPKRIEMMKMIYSKAMSGKDIAEALSLSTATVSHHIDQMRKVKLLNEERDKNTKYFSVNKNAFAKISTDLKNYIL